MPSPARRLVELPVGDGAEVAAIYPALRALLDDSGPALLPVPAADPARARLLREAMAPDTPIDPRAGLVVATSGSTGTPKGAMLSAAALRASAAATEARLDGPGRWILALPAHHIAGLQVVLRALAAGHPPFLVDVRHGFSPDDLVGAATTAGREAGSDPVYVSLVPGQLLKVLDHPDPRPAAALASCAAVLLGGAAAEPGLLERAAARGISVVRTYGSSETAGGCVYDGLPLDGTEVEVDAESRIWLGGATVALGYRNAPGHAAFARPGWFRTDDAGTLAADGTLQVLGRLDGAVSVGGLTVLPEVVERALLAHPAVGQAVVVGVPDRRLGSRLEAMIVPAAGHTAPAAGELSDSVREVLGEHAAPAGYVVIQHLPTLANGKPDRQAIRRRLADG